MENNSSGLPLPDISSSSSRQQKGDMSFVLPAKASTEGLSQGSSSSQQLSSPSDQLIKDSLSNENLDEKSFHSFHDASPFHSQMELLPSAEGLLQNPSGSSSFDEKSQAEEESHCTPEEQEVSNDVKREMLKEKCKGVSILSSNSATMEGPSYVYLIGTAHVSEESCKAVRTAISLMQPEVVFVELCQKRSFILQRAHYPMPTASDMLASWKESRSNLLGILYSWFFAKVAAKLDVLPGSEFRAAYEEATACGAKVVLGDRDIEVTLRRTWGKMSTWHKMKFISAMVFQAFCLPKADQLNELIEKLQDADVLTLAFEELGKSFPTVMETIIDERDMFMAAVLRKLGEDITSIVAVVGRGHVAGIIRHWGHDVSIHNLMEIPPKQSIRNTTFKVHVVSALVALTSISLLVYYRRGLW